MSSMSSIVRAIENLRFEPITSKAVKVVKAAVVGRVVVLLGPNGTIYSSQVSAYCHYTFGCGLEETLRGCIKLGVLSAAAVKQHADLVALKRARDERRWAAKSLVDNAKTLGLKLTKAQDARARAALVEGAPESVAAARLAEAGFV